MSFGFTTAGIIYGVAAIAATGASIYAIESQNQIAGRQLGLAEDQQFKQDQAWQQLQQLISNPAGFFDSPVYKAAANQGTSSVAKSNAAQFGPNSGNEAAALQQFGQSFGQQQLLSQEQLLAGMSGTGFNPAGSLSGAGQSSMNAAGGLNSLAGILAFMSQDKGGGGSGFVPMNDPSLGGSTSGWGSLPSGG